MISLSRIQNLCRLFVQNHGIRDMVIRKLSLARLHHRFLLSKSSDGWNCVLVEIEKPHSLFFKPGTFDLHDDFYAALDQIHRWRHGLISVATCELSWTVRPCCDRSDSS